MTRPVTTEERIAVALERLADTWQAQIDESKAYRESLKNFEAKVQKETGPSFHEREAIALERIAAALEAYPEPT